MTEYRNEKKENRRVTPRLWRMTVLVCMVLLLLCACGKSSEVANVGQEQLQNTEQPQSIEQEPEIISSAKLLLEGEKESKQLLCIPVEAGITAENVVLENRYTDRELWIYIEQTNPSFYNENIITGDTERIADGWYEAGENHVILKFVMTEIMEYHSALENDSLQITMSYPKELYEQIVVVDPMGGGSDWGITGDGTSEKELTCQVAMLLQNKISEPGIKVYFTRTEDMEVSAEERLQLAEAVDADLYLCLGVSQAADTATYGIQAFYNEEYVIPELGNVQWADIVTRKVTTLASNKALGLLPAEENSLLQSLKMPAAQINLGFLTNPQECLLLQQESYQEKLAQGIAEAILEVYTNKNNGK